MCTCVRMSVYAVCEFTCVQEGMGMNGLSVHDVCLDEWCMHVYGCVRGRGSEWVCVRVCGGEVKIMGFERASL